ncbi:hypothetical protein COEREDRAFT_95000 [Coemansia reversa NRRL 1564]|uniref:Uncharacterized protein n=1 Tax=Coemansia reversa (strain ATCC 12441 / NRRL 1564) TaxID=763665 RepID=A0A2G5B0M7_COERN|nr:hypothetical protein COEREDRAFT_95000 [Coemansia reversa NRRL 1564]|eukprot:PIA12578.1 hypothetical protein COEREDRAFT_95000 [Coemansia reversa NRRL 1564]
MVKTFSDDTPITTTFGKIVDFSRALCKSWSPAFYISIVRDGRKEFSYDRFNNWFDLNSNNINWNILYPEDLCNAKLKSGKNKEMRCSNKSLTKVELRVTDKGDHYEEEIKTGFCGIHKDYANKMRYSEEVEKNVYSGSPPLKLESKGKVKIKKKLIRVPTPFSADESIGEQELVNLVLEMCKRVNRLELDKVAQDARINTLRDICYRQTNVTPELREEYRKEKLDNVVGKSANPSLVIDEIEAVDMEEKVRVRFEDVAPPELVKHLADKKEEIDQKWLDRLHRHAKERKQGWEIVDEYFKNNKVEKDGDVVVPTDKEIADSVKAKYLGPGAVLYSTPVTERVINTEGVGSIPRYPENVYEDFENTKIINNNIRKENSDYAKFCLEQQKRGSMFMPFKNPSTDPMQDFLKSVIVKVFSDGAEADWNSYYKYVEKVIFHWKIANRNAERTDGGKELIEGANKKFCETALTLNSDYGSRPSSRPNLLRAVGIFDDCVNEMLALLETFFPESKKKADIKRPITMKSEVRLEMENLKKELGKNKKEKEKDSDKPDLSKLTKEQKLIYYMKFKENIQRAQREVKEGTGPGIINPLNLEDVFGKDNP